MTALASVLSTYGTLLLAALLFLAMLLLAEVGRKLGANRLRLDPESPKGIGAAEGAMFAMLGLLIAFSFSGAAGRFQDRRDLIVEESNAIGTAYLRLDLLPAETQPELRELMRRYVDNRIATYANFADMPATLRKLEEGSALQLQIWQKAVAASRREDAVPPYSASLLSALNEMIDITSTRLMAAYSHPPFVVMGLLGVLCLLGALLAGYGTAANVHRTWLHNVLLAAVLSLTASVTVDLEFPRVGLIRVDAADEMLVQVRKSMD